MRRFLKYFAATFLVGLAGIIALAATMPPDLTADQKAALPCSDDRIGWRATIRAQDYVKRQLKAPDTAKFAAATSTARPGETDQSCVYVVIGTVTASNSFGVPLRTSYRSEVRLDRPDVWSDVRTKLLGQ